jgi:hypothetical protein
MSSQVVNNLSLNLFGGYTAGTNGVELGGLFNIDKNNVQYLQAAGLFNSVGGTMKGLQAAGVNNMVFDSLKGFQVAGVYNHVSKTVEGVQAAGVANFAGRKVSGVQIAGVSNVSNREMSGVQIAGVVNYAKKLKGVQIGLINVADTSEGISIGLINFVVKGYHKLSFSANEIVNMNAALKTGTSNFYSMLMAGINVSDTSKVYSFGYGLGSEMYLNKKQTLAINPEISSQYLYLGSWDYINILNRFSLNFTIRPSKNFSIFAGPSFSVYYTDQKTGINGYRFPIPPDRYNVSKFSDKVTGWFGWNAGISLF